MMGHLNSFSASGGGYLNKNFPKIQMHGGLPGVGMLKLRFECYITESHIPEASLTVRKPVELEKPDLLFWQRFKRDRA